MKSQKHNHKLGNLVQNVKLLDIMRHQLHVYNYKVYFKGRYRAGSDSSSVPSTHKGWLTTSFNSGSKRSHVLLWPPQAPALTQTHIHKQFSKQSLEQINRKSYFLKVRDYNNTNGRLLGNFRKMH